MNTLPNGRLLAKTFLLVASLFWLPTIQAQTQLAANAAATSERSLTTPDTKPTGYFNLPIKTSGGNQFWTDWRNFNNWRIQQNSETDHCRLIGPDNIRRAWGDYAHCKQVLDKKLATGETTQPTGQVVILLHGLVRTSKTMNMLQEFLNKQGYTTINFSYASSRKGISHHAQALGFLINGLDTGVTDIHFVAHSLGNLVIRRYLHDTLDSNTGRGGDSRIRRIVMLGPPNQGSHAARTLKANRMFRLIAGKSGDQLAREWESVEPTLATPTMEFGIIAGGQSTDSLGNPFVPGKDDYTVSIDETKLAGATDFLVRPLLHGTMMNQSEVLSATHRFFQTGYFVSEETRTPIPLPAE